MALSSARSENKVSLICTHDELGGMKSGHDMRLDALFIEDTDVVGIDNSKNQLISMLDVGDKDLLIVTVVGMGGLGKTTLVRKVYESHVKGRFDCQAWITISQSFTSLELLRASFKSFKNEINEESWKLFCKKAFRGEYKNVCPEEMHDISRSIMKKCGGLPLAIVVLGGLLVTKEKHVLEWQKILKSLSPDTRVILELESLERILLLSYNDLPNHLKYCILYTSMFPEDYHIRRSRLIRLWVSEGFAEDKPGYTREEVADVYLNELINRSMIQIVLKSNYNKVKCCQLHDVLRDILQRKSRDESFSIVLKDEELLQSSEKIHRVAIYENFHRQTVE
ncbi:disease resistance protein RPM1-like [Impatiens glandulifera]|uniref:disease resistance protein RPM1-like n=1 Tax=Impatiens glandulifera TaxID=253017 RepID=UPI001FB0511E|nr:disease resistance protein RPM1-like [Impatiens glandulifera]